MLFFFFGAFDTPLSCRRLAFLDSSGPQEQAGYLLAARRGEERLPEVWAPRLAPAEGRGRDRPVPGAENPRLPCQPKAARAWLFPPLHPYEAK